MNHSEQLGFKKNSSCTHAVFLMNETIKVAKKEKKRAFVVSIEMMHLKPLIGWIGLNYGQLLNPKLITASQE